MFSKVPGRQTVPRAELWALLTLMRRMREGQRYTVYVDAAYVINGLKARTNHYARGLNGDIWTLIFREAEKLGGLEIKVKSHVKTKAQWEKYAMTRQAYLYNIGADAVASKGGK